MGYGYDEAPDDDDEGETTITFGEGTPIAPVDALTDLPTPPMQADPSMKARCYVHKEEEFYEWDGESWTKAD